MTPSPNKLLKNLNKNQQQRAAAATQWRLWHKFLLIANFRTLSTLNSQTSTSRYIKHASQPKHFFRFNFNDYVQPFFILLLFIYFKFYIVIPSNKKRDIPIDDASFFCFYFFPLYTRYVFDEKKTHTTYFEMRMRNISVNHFMPLNPFLFLSYNIFLLILYFDIMHHCCCWIASIIYTQL